MKTRTISKKLSVNKTIIANLKPGEMKEVNGGWIPTSSAPWCPCPHPLP